MPTTDNINKVGGFLLHECKDPTGLIYILLATQGEWYIFAKCSHVSKG